MGQAQALVLQPIVLATKGTGVMTERAVDPPEGSVSGVVGPYATNTAPAGYCSAMVKIFPPGQCSPWAGERLRLAPRIRLPQQCRLDQAAALPE